MAIEPLKARSTINRRSLTTVANNPAEAARGAVARALAVSASVRPGTSKPAPNDRAAQRLRVRHPKAGRDAGSTAQRGSGFGYVYRAVTIPASGGVDLTGYVVTPKDRDDGPFPLIVMVASWATPDFEYILPAIELATLGFTTVMYTARGFYGSQGEIDVAGPLDQADVSAVIDWAYAQADLSLPGDRATGMMGISYGAGLALLGSALDERVTVVAALSAFTDLPNSTLVNGTISLQSSEALSLSSAPTGRPGPLLQEAEGLMLLVLSSGRQTRSTFEGILPAFAERSPISHLAQLAERKPAIYIGNAWNDSIFPPSTIVPFFEQLSGPKHLRLAPGDHASDDAIGLFGLSDPTWQEGTSWMMRYLRPGSVARAMPPPAPVHLIDVTNGLTRDYASWGELPPLQRSYLTATRGLLRPAGSLASSAPATGWKHTIWAGVPTLANSGLIEITAVLQAVARVQNTVPLALISRTFSAVWTGRPQAQRAIVDGSPALHVRVASSSGNATVVAYLYDVDEFGFASLMTHAPFTLLDIPKGQPQTVDFALEPIAWTIAKGHALALVIGTVDWRYYCVGHIGDTVRVVSDAADPAYLDVPLRTAPQT